MPNDTQLKWIKPTRQARSQQTLERLLDAAELVLKDEGLEGLTVAAVAKRAESSVGSFYARFKDKEGLLRCLFERFNDQAIATSQEALRPERWAEIPLEHALRLMVRFIIEIFEDKRGVVVAMTARSTTDADVVQMQQALNEELVAGLLKLLHERQTEMTHSDPAMATRMLVWLTMSGLQTRLTSKAANAAVSDEQTAHEIARICTSYLGITGTRTADASAAPASPSRAQVLSVLRAG